jgi:1,4-alpha-glucan branching enzyme
LSKLIDASDPTSFWARKRSLLAAVTYMTSPGLPMVFQGEEMLESWSFSDHTGYRWDSTNNFFHSGAISAYQDLIHARRNLKGGTAGLKGTGCDVYHVDNNNKVIAYKRWDAGGDDVVVVLNCGITAWSNNNYSIQFPSTGTWYLQFNSDATQLLFRLQQHRPFIRGRFRLSRHSKRQHGPLLRVDLFKTAPSKAGTSQVAPCNGGCDSPLSSPIRLETALWPQPVKFN